MHHLSQCTEKRVRIDNVRSVCISDFADRCITIEFIKAAYERFCRSRNIHSDVPSTDAQNYLPNLASSARSTDDEFWADDACHVVANS